MAEQQILFEAITAAANEHQFVLQRSAVQQYRPARQRVQVLERDGLRMQDMQLAQGVERRRARSGITDALEVRIEIDRTISLHWVAPYRPKVA